MEPISFSSGIIMAIICLVLLLVLFFMIYGINLGTMDNVDALIETTKCICIFLLLTIVFYLIFDKVYTELILKCIES